MLGNPLQWGLALLARVLLRLLLLWCDGLLLVLLLALLQLWAASKERTALYILFKVTQKRHPRFGIENQEGN